jgi:hypothetical protein
MRDARVSFVNVRYGGNDEYAIGSTGYAADVSDTEKLVNRELNKLLRKYAHKGVVDVEGNSSRISDNYYWTDAALASGKNWHLFLGKGVRKEDNKDMGLPSEAEMNELWLFGHSESLNSKSVGTYRYTNQ